MLLEPEGNCAAWHVGVGEGAATVGLGMMGKVGLGGCVKMLRLAVSRVVCCGLSNVAISFACLVLDGLVG